MNKNNRRLVIISGPADIQTRVNSHLIQAWGGLPEWDTHVIIPEKQRLAEKDNVYPHYLSVLSGPAGGYRLKGLWNKLLELRPHAILHRGIYGASAKLAISYGKRHSVPLAFEPAEHEFNPLGEPRNQSSHIFNLQYRWFWNKHISFFIAPSHRAFRFIHHRIGVKKDKVQSFLPLEVNDFEEKDLPDRLQARKELGLDSDANVIMVLDGRDWEWHTAELRRALVRLLVEDPGTQLLLLQDPRNGKPVELELPEELRSRLDRTMPLGLAERLKCYRAADIYLCSDSVSPTGFEAVKYGLPVFYPDSADGRERAGLSLGYTMPANDGTAIYQQLNDCLLNPDLHNQLGEKYRAAYKALSVSRPDRKKTSEILISMLGKSNRKRRLDGMLRLGIDGSMLGNSESLRVVKDFLESVNPERDNLGGVVIWGARKNLELLPDYAWLARVPVPMLEHESLAGLWRKWLFRYCILRQRCQAAFLPHASVMDLAEIPLIALQRSGGAPDSALPPVLAQADGLLFSDEKIYIEALRRINIHPANTLYLPEAEWPNQLSASVTGLIRSISGY